MCGRFALIVDASVLADVFDVDPPRELQPRFNIAPTQTIPIVRAGKEAPRECALVRWGLVPSWAKDEKIGARMINARGETVAEKPS
jgi:putative SOS response-associated peptidase YedK